MLRKLLKNAFCGLVLTIAANSASAQIIYQSVPGVIAYDPYSGAMNTADTQIHASAFDVGRIESMNNGTLRMVNRPVHDNFGNVIGYERGVEWMNSLTGQVHRNTKIVTLNGTGSATSIPGPSYPPVASYPPAATYPSATIYPTSSPGGSAPVFGINVSTKSSMYPGTFGTNPTGVWKPTTPFTPPGYSPFVKFPSSSPSSGLPSNPVIGTNTSTVMQSFPKHSGLPQGYSRPVIGTHITTNKSFVKPSGKLNFNK